ncbi:MAG: ribonuclease HI [bacterium]|nr:ribonuclease HI [bacterium]
MIIDDALNIYTDGSSFSGPRKGGIGIRFITIDDNGNEVCHDIEQSGYKGATNNQMELYACMQALKEARRIYDLSSFNKIVINSDSRYVVDNHTRALFNWSKNKWRNREGRPVENAGIWRELLKAIKRTNRIVEFNWVQSHSKDEHNKAVDKLAKGSARSATNKPLTVVSVRKKKTDKAVEIGSVKMQGQRLLVHIITTEYLRPQSIYKYKYEVISRKSKYYGYVDLIFSKLSIRDGHCYCVSLNKNTGNPMIVNILAEIDCKTGERIS